MSTHLDSRGRRPTDRRRSAHRVRLSDRAYDEERHAHAQRGDEQCLLVAKRLVSAEDEQRLSRRP